MQINTICNIFCTNNLRKAPNHEKLIEQYHECVKPIINSTTQQSELKRLTKTYGRPLIQLCNNLQKELSTDTKQISQNIIKIRHTLLQIALLTDQCLVKLKGVLKMKQWSIEKMWNSFLCRAVSYRFWDLLTNECDIFLNYLNCLNSDVFSNQDLSEYVSLFTSNLYNKSRALIEINFNKYYKESTELLQKSIQLCGKHMNIQWKITYLDKTFRVMNKIITDFCNNNNNKNEEFALRSQALYCLLLKNKLIKEKNIYNKENNIVNKINNSIPFWDITNQYIRFVKNRYKPIDLIRFRKSIIEIYMQYEIIPMDNEYDIKFINLCIDYMVSIGECKEKLKIDILSKIMQQLSNYIDNINAKMEFKMIINVVKSVVLTQIGLKHDMEYIKNAIKAWDNVYLLLKENNYLFKTCCNNEIWKLLAKSIRNIPYLIRNIEDICSFKSDKNDLYILNLCKTIVLNVEQLFNIWHNCNTKIISKEKLKNANHRLFDTLITVLIIEQKYFLCYKNNKIIDDIIHLLQLSKYYLCNNIGDMDLFKSLATKGYNIGVQIYNTRKCYDKILNIMEIISGLCIHYNDENTQIKCDKLYESSLFKCDNTQMVYSKLGRNIAVCIDMANKLKSNDISMSYKYLQLLVKYQTHSINKHKFIENNPSISIIDMLENIGIDFNNINENITINLLNEQLRLYQSSFSYNTTNQQIEILEILLKNYFFNQKPIQRAIALIDLAKLIRIHNPLIISNSNTSTPRKHRNNIELHNIFEDNEQDRNPLQLLEEATDLLNQIKISGVDDDEIDFKIIIDDILGAAYVWISIIKRELYATNQAIDSQISSLNSSMIQLDLDVNKNDNDDEDSIGFASMLKALDIYSNIITKYCKTKCKHIANNCNNNNIRECDKCHKCFRNLFSTMQHLQIIMDYMHLNNYITFEIFILDRMIRLLSTMSNNLIWCREYRLLCLCWLGIAYYNFGNINQSKKIFMELQPILLKTTPNISIYIKHNIEIIYAKYQSLTNQKQGIQTLLELKKQIEKNEKNKWEDVYIMCKLKMVLAQIQIESPQIFKIDKNTNISDFEPEILAKDSLIGYTRLIDKLNQQFTFHNESKINKYQNDKHSSTYNMFINSLPNKQYQFFGVSNKQYMSAHHPQSPIHKSHTKMLFHYPSEFRLISDFVKCIQILGECFTILHEPKHALYHFENGNKATYNLVVQQQQKLFLMNLAKIENKQKNFEKCNEYLNESNDISILLPIKLSSSLTNKIYNSLSKITPYASNYDKYMMDILYIEINGDQLRYKYKYKEAINEYDKCLIIIQSFLDAKPIKPMNINQSQMDLIPILRLKCSIKSKCALCLLYLRDSNSLQQCMQMCFKILEYKSILNDLMIAKIKLYIGECLILQIQYSEIMQIIWKGDNDTNELESILCKNMINNNNEIFDIDNINISMDIKYFDKYDTNEIAIIICCRQNLIQSLLILLHLKIVNPELIKHVSFALSYIYGYTNVKWSAMFLNICQSVNIRQAAIKQYTKQIFDIKKQWHEFKTEKKRYNYKENNNINNCNDITIEEFEMSVKKLKAIKKNDNNYKFNPNDYLTSEEYNSLYTRFYHKLTSIQYYGNLYLNNEEILLFDYNNLECCFKIINIICDKFYNHTMEYLQYSWNCVSIEVDNLLLQTILISSINPKSKSRNIPNEIIIIDIPINNNNKKEEKKDEENNYNEIINDFDLFFNELHESTQSGKECVTKNEAKIWWDNRYILDNKLKNYLNKFEYSILGIFKCLFIPHFRQSQSKKLVNSSCNVLVTAINEYLSKKSNNKYLLTCFVNENTNIRSSKMLLFQKLLQLMLICYNNNNNDNQFQPEINDDEIKYGLSYIFNVNDNYLLNKLLDTITQHIITINNKFSSQLNVNDFDPLIISISDTLKHLPWENIPILKYCLPSICRIPCLEFASLRVMQYKNYNFNKNNKNNYYFVINPKNDLKKTEQRFDRLLNNEWNGIKGKEPTINQFRNGLEKNNVFLYIGHNAGEEFANCQKLKTFNIKSITFLMGCSSGLLKKKGIFQSNGISNYYMIASAPIVVANLWDVTDKDIDQFTASLLRKSILKQNSNEGIIDVSKAVNISRSICKLKYINGAAPICYGIPFHLVNGIVV